jgi:hypothetical protein
MTADEWLKLHGKYERFAYPKFRNGLRLSYQPLLDSLNMINYENYQFLIPMLVNRKPLTEAYNMVYSKVGLTHGKAIGRELNQLQDRKRYVRDLYESEFLKAIYEWVQTNLGRRIQDVNDYTIELIQQLVVDAMDRNMTVSQMTSYLQRSLTNPKFNRMRALRIARTETTTAANHGAFVAAESSDLVLDKHWIAVVDKRTRHSHLLEHGKIAPQYEPFTMSDGSLLMYPGDQKGMAAQIINCRCSYSLLPRRDADGLLIFK